MFIQLYLGCRWGPLFSVIVQFLGFDVSHEIGCRVRSLLTRALFGLETKLPSAFDYHDFRKILR